MLHRERIKLPEYIYPPEEWCLKETQFAPEFLEATETIFSTSNGYFGMRGAPEEGRPAYHNGTFVNGFYESWPIVHVEDAFGFAKTGQTIVNVPGTKVIKLYVDDEPFFMPTANLKKYERTLNMREGTLDREILWKTPSGKEVQIRSKRLISMQDRHLGAISYEVTVLNAEASVDISSEVVTYDADISEENDPRQCHSLGERVLEPIAKQESEMRIIYGFRTHNSKMSLACGIDHVFETECKYSTEVITDDNSGKIVYSIDASPAKTIKLTKFFTYHSSRGAPPKELVARADRTLDRAMQHGFTRIWEDQKNYMAKFWEQTDVKIEGDPALQQAVRWNLFQMMQATCRAEGSGVPAKGLTGQGYDGHYFWDTEIYLMPFLIYTSPRIARNLLQFRYSMLDKARQRANEVNQKGALFPWRTINGEEASAYYAAGTAQYHINADIVYTLRRYVDISGDEDFLYEAGAEMLVETSRLWVDLGFFSERLGNKFCIHGVTGPDEYNTVVNNNTYTNLMARENLWYACEVVRMIQNEHPHRYAQLRDKTGLDAAEVDLWKRAADNMFIPFDEKLGIHPQDDDFLDKKIWDFKDTPADNYPLLLHYHPLVIYRYQVIKQADIVLAMFLLEHEFLPDQKKRNFDYYDPLTTGDSSLSVSIQSIVAFECGYLDKAREYAWYAARMDLADIHKNVKEGCHVASMGGTWMAIVYGYAGLRDFRGRIAFNPVVPERGLKISFPLIIRNQIIEVCLDGKKEEASYLLRNGEDFHIIDQGEEITLQQGKAISRAIEPKQHK